jgi:hypothetical protein
MAEQANHVDDGDVGFIHHSDQAPQRREVTLRTDSVSMKEAANECSLSLSPCSPPMAMMAPTMVMTAVPTIVTTAVPTVVVAVTAVMAPPMPMPMPMSMSVSVSVSALDLNDRPLGVAQGIGCCRGHSRRRHGWCKYKSKADKSDDQEPFHLNPSSLLVSGPRGLSVPFLQCCLNGMFIGR